MERTASSDRRDSLSISAILNEDSVEPKGQMMDIISDSKRKRYTWPGCSNNSILHPLGSFQPNVEEPMNIVPVPTTLQSPPRYVTSKSDSNQILVPEEATIRQLPDGFVVCGITKGKRKRISPEQLKALLEVFEQTDTPSSQLREELAERLNMSKREVQVWFQNRRAKASRMRNNSQDPFEKSTKHRRKSTSSGSFGIPNTFVPPPFPANPAIINDHRPRRYSAVPVLQTVARPFTNIQSLRPNPAVFGIPHPPAVPQFTNAWAHDKKQQRNLPHTSTGSVNNSFPNIAPKPSSISPMQDVRMSTPPTRPRPFQPNHESSYPSEMTEHKNSPISMLASAAEFVSSKDAAHPVTC
ncbi:hypothetical protein K450DRAFT_253230 [Umbelopsis ramanniana AG]|uniref:Homeobox domain-containing protein n=1 Tax=Umbelopsis ramanniana AG TaxID=1314678 RepID=A0AAD5E4S7_UMBRA|nr:uncharacterized protein K450DRAFT_253230 [Umbelopsis ramanniana AG]KAI8577178.1 hypothetical protein K450DRAFT_253230 [Umbelopsis ramanniana AG]